MPAGDGLKPLGVPTSVPGLRARVALGLAVFAGVAIVSYAGQRLGSWTIGEPAPGAVLASIYTDYFWRLALSVLHGLVAGAAVGLSVSVGRATNWLLPAGRWVLLTVVISMVAMALVP
jgi:hypothetical protein